jgi:hypothetical protein
MSGSNANVARGLVPYANAYGKPFNDALLTVFCPASDANNIFVGDPVVFTQSTSDAAGVPGVTLATGGSTNKITGVMLGITNNAGQLVDPVLQSSPVYRQASVATYIGISWDPDNLYWVQEDSVGGALAATAGGGQLASLVAGAGSTFTGFSGWQLQSSSLGTGSQVQIIKALQQIDNYVPSANAKWLVRIVGRLPAY